MTPLESQNAVKIRGKVLEYFQPEMQPTSLSDVLQKVEDDIKDVSEEDIRDVILRLIASGKLMYSSDMRISLGT
ncbi:MAG TPA: hypothetical protein VNH65_06455 [Candidatus Acidoferrum sp.]|nr:hypothetical protein [Candidatus Acidoferrum sp.]